MKGGMAASRGITVHLLPLPIRFSLVPPPGGRFHVQGTRKTLLV